MFSNLGKKTQAKFKRDAEGKLDPGISSGDKKSDFHLKFTEEARFCFGAAIALEDGV